MSEDLLSVCYAGRKRWLCKRGQECADSATIVRQGLSGTRGIRGPRTNTPYIDTKEYWSWGLTGAALGRELEGFMLTSWCLLRLGGEAWMQSMMLSKSWWQ